MTKILDEYHTNIPELIKELPRAHLDTKIKSKIFYAELNILDFNNKILSYEEKSKHLRGFSQYIPISEFPKNNLEIYLIQLRWTKILQSFIS